MPEFAFAAELGSLAKIREKIKLFSEEQEFPEKLTYHLMLSVDEACTNIITHGYKGMNPGTILLNIERFEDRVEITLTDFGRSFEPAPPPRPDLDDLVEGNQVGGFGLYIIYETMDEVDYEATPAGNHLRLTKYLEGRQSNPTARRLAT